MPLAYKRTATSSVALGALALLLAGCHVERREHQPLAQADPAQPFGEIGTYVEDLSHTASWRQIQRQPDNLVQIVGFDHQVSFAVGEDRLQPAERARLADFLGEIKLGYGDKIVLDGPRRAGDGFDPVTAERLEGLRAELTQMGFDAAIAGQPSGETAQQTGEAVSVQVSKAVVIPPECAQAQPELGHRPAIAMGCSNTTNLGLMVANPRDLTEGGTLGPADGEAATLAIQRYRKGEVTPLTKLETSK